MDFHAAMETFAEAWVAANTQTAVNTEQEPERPSTSDSVPSLVPREQLSPEIRKPQVQAVTPGSGTKSLPIHCIVEQMPGVPTFDPHNDCITPITVELDSYAILPSNTQMCELVRTALIKLGYNSAEIMGAKGAIQIKNWKPLSFDMITDDPQSVIDDILGEITSMATLRIRLTSKLKISSTDEVKEKLLHLLLTQSKGLLMSSGCPIEQGLLTCVSNGVNPAIDISTDMRKAFDNWYKTELEKSEQQCRAAAAEDQLSPIPAMTPTTVTTPSTSNETKSPTTPLRDVQSPPTTPMCGRTRMRTSFDPEQEIPRLQSWFQQNMHPTREQMIHYLQVLNVLDTRSCSGAKKLDLTNIIYWFKNARAALRRANKSQEELDTDEASEETLPVNVVDPNLPYLPNRNAVYMVPYPLHKTFSTNDKAQFVPSSDGVNCENKQVCPVPKEDFPSTALNMVVDKTRDGQRETTMERETICEREITGDGLQQPQTSPSMQPDTAIKQEVVPAPPDDAVVKESSILREDVSHSHLSNGDHNKIDDRFAVESDDDDDDDDGLNERSSDTYSESSQDCEEPQNLCIKREGLSEQEYLQAMQMSAAQQAMQLSQLSHPMAMHYLPLSAHYYAQQHQIQQQQQQQSELHRRPLGEKRRRTRVFIDPLSEIPKLEKWFIQDTHPSSYMIDKFCDELNRAEYRQKFPKLEAKNVQLWFKNHRAKVKRMRLEDCNGVVTSEHLSPLYTSPVT